MSTTSVVTKAARNGDAFAQRFEDNTTTVEHLHWGVIKTLVSPRFYQALKKNTSIAYLGLYVGKVSAREMQDFWRALGPNQGIQELRCSFDNNRELPKELALALANNTKLTTLRVIGGVMTNEVAYAWGEFFATNSTLTEFHLDCNWRDDPPFQMFDGLARNTTLKKLIIYMAHTNIQALIRAMEQNTSIEELEIYNIDMEKNDAEWFAEMLRVNRTLKNFWLRAIRLDTDGIRTLTGALKTNTTLITLSLYGNNIGDEGAIAIEFNQALEYLSLSGNNITDVGAIAIMNALKNNRTLKSLSLVDNRITNAGAKALCRALVFHPTLSLSLCYRHNTWSHDAHARRQIVVLQSAANLPENTAVQRFVKRDGDHALCTRVFEFLVW